MEAESHNSHHDSVKRKGFDVSNSSQRKRNEVFQEEVNKVVVSKLVKVLNVPNKERRPIQEVAKKFLSNVVKYNNNDDPCPLSWIRSAGMNGESSSFKAEMSFLFWSFFISHGRANLSEFNKKNNAQIRVVRGQTNRVRDLEKLSLYLRKRLRNYCHEKRMIMPDIRVSGSYLIIQVQRTDRRMKIKSSVLAVQLGMDYSDWQGAPIKDLLTKPELNNLENGSLKWNSITVDRLLSLNLEESSQRVDDARNSRKRDANSQERGSTKKSRPVHGS
ncbi:hypothetical protein GCK32_014399 [Trichostrongylus colubriformis]|uniref:Uncharacterized protein n=1 Tax=Trichostrongylus colubriformis TaxID=6319 RepID=A0AAN8IEG3_TRICO